MQVTTVTPESLRLFPERIAVWRPHRLCPPPSQFPKPGMSPAMRLVYEGGRSLRMGQKSWSGAEAAVAEMHCDGPLRVDLSAPSARLSVVLDQAGGRFEIQSDGWRGQSASIDIPQPMSVIPVGIAARGRADGIRFFRHLVVQFDSGTLAAMVGDEIDVTNALAPRPTFLNAGIMRLAQLVAEECTADQPHGQLYGDNLSMALLLALSRLGAPKARLMRKGQLAPWQLRRVTDYLTAHLAEDIGLQAVADLAKLSRSYFSRAFKVSAGLAPHQWLQRARINKAKELLLETNDPLAQVAIDVGFADQAHFSRTFRREVGESPRAWQRSRRS